MRPGKRNKKVGDYTVIFCLGGGRYGVCFLAQDQKGEYVVLKRFRRRMWEKNQGQNHHEAVILSGLENPAVPQMLGVVNCPEGYYFVLEYKEGTTLEKLLFTEKKVFSSEEIFRIGVQIFDILEYLHGRNVVHGDISTSNIVDNGKQIFLIDFGLARFADHISVKFSLDYARAANVILYLLYSRYEGKGNRPWHEELPLSGEQKVFLQKLMEPDRNYGKENVKKEFQRLFYPVINH